MWFLIQHVCVAVSCSEAGQTYERLLMVFAARSASSLICVIPTARAIPVCSESPLSGFILHVESELILVFSKTDSKAFTGGIKIWCWTGAGSLSCLTVGLATL